MNFTMIKPETSPVIVDREKITPVGIYWFFFYYSLINNNIINNRQLVRNPSVGHGKQVHRKEKSSYDITQKQRSQQKTQDSTFGIAFS